MHHTHVFNVAERLHRADHLNSRFWRKRKDIPKKQPDVGPTALEELANAVAAYYWERQGRGSPCRAEAYLRVDRYHYLFVYPKDYADTFTGYVKGGPKLDHGGGGKLDHPARWTACLRVAAQPAACEGRRQDAGAAASWRACLLCARR